MVAKRPELVLVVDDHPLNQQLAVLLLQQFGFDAHVAGSACDAMRLYGANAYHLVLMDCQMPDVDGYEAAQQIRTIDGMIGRRVPVIAVTAGWSSSDERHLRAGMDDLLPKPLEPSELLKLLNKWLPADAHHQANQPVVNVDAVGQRLGVENVPRFLEMFAADYQIQIELLKQALGEQNYSEVLDLAHRLRGACAAVSAIRVKTLCKQIAEAGRNRDWITVGQTVQRIVEHEGPAVIEFIESYLEFCCPAAR